MDEQKRSGAKKVKSEAHQPPVFAGDRSDQPPQSGADGRLGRQRARLGSPKQRTGNDGSRTEAPQVLRRFRLPRGDFRNLELGTEARFLS